ncbi:MAG: efflux RND transporter periplasmic adaptor subunit [Microgenomates group bacterium]
MSKKIYNNTARKISLPKSENIMSKLFKFLSTNWKKVVVLTLVLIGILLFVFRNNNKTVKSTEVKRGDLKEELILSGEVDATNYAKLAYETSGKINYVGVKEGEKVNKGKLISKLDSTVLNSNYQIAMSNLRIYDATAQNILDQVKDNSNDETFAQKDTRTTAEANKDKAYEAVIVAKRNLDGASLYAPFNGIVTYLAHPFIGVYTSLGAVEAEIIDPSTIYFDVLADQTEVTRLSVGQKVEIVLDPFEEKTFEGKVSNISFVPKIGESGSVYSVKVDFVNVDLLTSQFKISMTGDSKFVVSEKKSVLFVPNNYVKQDKDGRFVKITAKGEKLYIETGIESEEYTEIIGKLTEGLTVYD